MPRRSGRGFKGVDRPHGKVERGRAHPRRKVHWSGIGRDQQIERAHDGREFRQTEVAGTVGRRRELAQASRFGRGFAFGRAAEQHGAQPPAQKQGGQSAPERRVRPLGGFACAHKETDASFSRAGARRRPAGGREHGRRNDPEGFQIGPVKTVVPVVAHQGVPVQPPVACDIPVAVDAERPDPFFGVQAPGQIQRRVAVAQIDDAAVTNTAEGGAVRGKKDHLRSQWLQAGKKRRLSRHPYRPFRFEQQQAGTERKRQNEIPHPLHLNDQCRFFSHASALRRRGGALASCRLDLAGRGARFSAKSAGKASLPVPRHWEKSALAVFSLF